MEEQISRINLSRVDSTNNFVRDMLSFGDQLDGMTLVVAEAQSAGRGQAGNHWEAEPGQNLTFSLLCHPDFVPASRQFIISQCIALAIVQALQAELPATGDPALALSIKWPNDIYVGDRKICGTLIECDLRGKNISNCIIGTGLNVNQTRFLSDAPNPVSLKQLTHREHDREAILAAICSGFQTRYDQVRQGEDEAIRQDYAERLYRRRGMHRYADVRGEFMAEIAAVEPTGHLLLRLEDGNTCRYEFKEVRFIL